MSLDRTHRSDAGSVGLGGGRRDLVGLGVGLGVGVGLTVVAVGDGRCRVGRTVVCVGAVDAAVGAGSGDVVAGRAAE